MGIAYLQKLKILPNLQAQNELLVRRVISVPATRDPFGEQRSVDVSFFNVQMTAAELKNKFEQDSELVWGENGVCSLLQGFLHYYGFEYPYGQGIAVSVKDGGFVPYETKQESRLIVLDPFEEDRNCTSFVIGSLKAIISEFKSGHQAFKEGKPELLFIANAAKPKTVNRRRSRR